ncbi:MAG: phytanoyl-CoA dioxygenase family protein [Proteobacteria bacterium]|nr:phytanoyl-CoA dioxygenase family protein [Pseudomonadota bacterium]
MLNKQEISQYKEQGFVILNEAIDLKMIDRIKAQAAKIVEHKEPDSLGHIFTTNNNNRTDDNYFFDSAEKISRFFEEDAFNQEGNLVQDPTLCINKLGHALHELDSVFNEFSHLPFLGKIAKAIGMKEPQIRQSMYIFKQPRIGGVVNWHQDTTYFYTTPQSVVTFWFAIEDATMENGCLWVEPGGHLSPLRERFIREGMKTKMESLDKTPWPETADSLAVEVDAGSLIVFHGNLPHYSAPNRSAKSRQAYTLHVTDGMTEYAKENWLQAQSLPLRGFDS